MLRRDKKLAARQVKILLLGWCPEQPCTVDDNWRLFYLGAGESGKSTILKQMRIIYAEGFRPDERREVRQIIFSNMIVAFKIIAEEMRELGVEYKNQKSQVYFLPDLSTDMS